MPQHKGHSNTTAYRPRTQSYKPKPYVPKQNITQSSVHKRFDTTIQTPKSPKVSLLNSDDRETWKVASQVKVYHEDKWHNATIIHIESNNELSGTDWLHILINQTSIRKKIDRMSILVQPVSLDTDDWDEEEEVKTDPNIKTKDQLDDEFINDLLDFYGNEKPPEIKPFQELSTLETLETLTRELNTNSVNPQISSHVPSQLSTAPTLQNELNEQMKKQLEAVCGYTLWVNWCDSSELHGYYHCVGFKNEHFAFRHKKDENAEVISDKKGYWYLTYNGTVLYKSRDKSEHPPPRRYKCINGSLPPPGVSRVDLPTDGKSMVEIDKKRLIKTGNNDGYIFVKEPKNNKKPNQSKSQNKKSNKLGVDDEKDPKKKKKNEEKVGVRVK